MVAERAPVVVKDGRVGAPGHRVGAGVEARATVQAACDPERGQAKVVAGALGRIGAEVAGHEQPPDFGLVGVTHADAVGLELDGGVDVGEDGLGADVVGIAGVVGLLEGPLAKVQRSSVVGW